MGRFRETPGKSEAEIRQIRSQTKDRLKACASNQDVIKALRKASYDEFAYLDLDEIPFFDLKVLDWLLTEATIRVGNRTTTVCFVVEDPNLLGKWAETWMEKIGLGIFQVTDKARRMVSKCGGVLKFMELETRQKWLRVI